MKKCSKCGATEDDYTDDSNRHVKLTPVRLGHLCEPCYMQANAQSTQDDRRRKVHDVETGQLSMFEDMENL